MPTLTEIVEQFSFLATTPAVAALMFTGGIIVVIQDWRVSLLALVIQYVIAGFLLTNFVRPELAAIKALVGAMLCLILYMTARRVDWGHRPSPPPPPDQENGAAGAPTPQWILPTELPFRFLAVLLVLVASYGGASAYTLPDVNEAISLSVYILAALGLLAMGLTDEPLKAGMGLLTFVLAFELFYTVLEPSLAVVGFLGLANFLIALAIAYLAVVRATAAQAEAERQERRGEND